MPISTNELTHQFTLALIPKAGVRLWTDGTVRQSLLDAAAEMAENVTSIPSLADAASQFAMPMLYQLGVREWESAETRETLITTALEMAAYQSGVGFPPIVIMPSKVLVQEMDGTPKQITFGDYSNDFSPTSTNDLRLSDSGSREDVQMQFASTASVAFGSATTTGATQSDKFDFGENRAAEYKVRACLELAATPSAGSAIYIYLAPSSSATAGVGNPGGVSGSAGTYSGYSSNGDASLKQLTLIGIGTVTSQASSTCQIMECGRFSPSERYGSLVFRNVAGASVHSDDVECHIVLDPIVDEIQ